MFKWVKTYYHYILGGIHIHYPAIFRVPRLIIFNLRPSMSGTGGKTTRSLLYPLISSENSVSPYLLLKSVKSQNYVFKKKTPIKSSFFMVKVLSKVTVMFFTGPLRRWSNASLAASRATFFQMTKASRETARTEADIQVMYR